MDRVDKDTVMDLQRKSMEDLSNSYCSALHIPIPSLEEVKDHREANTFALLLVAVLERGGPMTLAQVAQRFDEAGISTAEDALCSLRRCRPARPPVYRDGDLYALDLHDEDLDLWVFRLGRRPAKVPALKVVKPEPAPLAGPDVSLSTEELEESFKGAYLGSWSARRLAIAVFDAHGGQMPGAEAVTALSRLTTHQRLREDAARYWRTGAPVQSLVDGTWVLDLNHPHVPSARQAVRDKLEMDRKYRDRGPDPAVFEAQQKCIEKKRQAHAEKLAGLRRVLIHVFPEKLPEAVVLVDVANRELTSYVGNEMGTARARLAEYDLLGAVNVRSVLQSLEIDPAQRRLVELGPPQKTRRLNKRGRTLKITLSLLVQGTCGISKPFGDPERLRGYLDRGEMTKLRRRLEADAKSLFAIYQYGRLHGAVRLRWGFLDEMIPAPWRHHDEQGLYGLIHEAHQQRREVEGVVGSAPGWAEPWSRARRCQVVQETEWRYALVDEEDRDVDEWEVQLARLAPS
jgi:hypothetical protein